MSVGRSSKNNVMAGLFVLAALALALTVIIVMSNIGERFTPQTPYVVRFSVADGAEGLDPGAAVKVGGQRVGRVISTEIQLDPATGEPTHLDVTIKIPKHIKLYSDADVQLMKPLLGTGSTINIISFSGMAVGGQVLHGPPKLLLSGDMLRGRLGAPGFITPTDYARLQSIIARVDRIAEEAEPQIKTIMDDASAAVADVRKISAEASAKWPEWSRQASNVIERIDKGSESFDRIVVNINDASKSIKDGVEEARRLVDRGRAVVDENRKSLDEIVANVKSLTEKASGEWARQVTGIMDRATETLQSAEQTAKEVQELVTKKVPQLEDMITNASLAAQQLKLATVEIRASPWRLLYQPTKKELENELLYNTVRQYSDAVGELKAAADSLRSISQRAQQGGAVDQSSVNAMTAKLREAFEKYQQQERAFLERWAKSEPSGASRRPGAPEDKPPQAPPRPAEPPAKRWSGDPG